MKKLSILSLALLSLLALTGIASAFGESNAPNANLNARVSRGFTPEREAVRSVTGIIKNDVQRAKNYIGDRVDMVERVVDRVQNTVEAATTPVDGQNPIERTVSTVRDNANQEYDSFRENFNEVVKDKVVTLKQGFNNKMSDVSRRVNERVINPIGNTVGNTIQNSGGSVSTKINAIFRRY